MTEQERFERYKADELGVNNNQKFEAWFEQEYKVKLSRWMLESGKYDALFVATRKAWKAAAAQAVPEGYVVMPIEPTPEMYDAGKQAHIATAKVVWRTEQCEAIYKAMIAAAQEPT